MLWTRPTPLRQLHLEVSSAGADRALKKPEHFAQFQGAEVEVKLYRARDGRKDYVGLLESYEDGDVTLNVARAHEI